MKLYYLVSVEVDTAAIIEDNPPESIELAVASELYSHLGDTTVRRALGVVGVEVESLGAVTAQFAVKCEIYDRDRAALRESGAVVAGEDMTS